MAEPQKKVKCVSCVSVRRIAYQEASQTFGIISMRTDIAEGSSAVSGPVRPSASTQVS